MSFFLLSLSVWQWHAFSVPELQNFLIILEKEEAERVKAVEQKYNNYRQKLQLALEQRDLWPPERLPSPPVAWSSGWESDPRALQTGRSIQRLEPELNSSYPLHCTYTQTRGASTHGCRPQLRTQHLPLQEGPQESLSVRVICAALNEDTHSGKTNCSKIRILNFESLCAWTKSIYWVVFLKPPPAPLPLHLLLLLLLRLLLLLQVLLMHESPLIPLHTEFKTLNRKACKLSLASIWDGRTIKEREVLGSLYKTDTVLVVSQKVAFLLLILELQGMDLFF